MAVDYDVVIIGGSPTGRYAAVVAAQLGAKVALVEPTLRGAGEIETAIAPHALAQIGQMTQQLSYANQLGIHVPNAADGESVQWAEAQQWASGVASDLEE